MPKLQGFKGATKGPIDEPLDSQEAFDSIQPTATAAESLGAMFKLSKMDATTQAIAQHAEISDAEAKGGELIQPKDLNEQYPDLQTPFVEPKTKAVADIIAERQRKRAELEQTIANGPQGRIMGAARFGAALLPHAIDPINLGSGVALSALTEGLGLFKAGGEAVMGAEEALAAAQAAGDASKIAEATQALKIATQGTSGMRFIRHAGEGIVANMGTEALVARAAVQEGREYNLDDAFYNTVGGAMLVPGVMYGGEKALLGLRYTGRFALNRAAEYAGRIDPKYAEFMQSSSLARLLADKRPVPALIHESVVRGMEGDTPEAIRQRIRENYGVDVSERYQYARTSPEEMVGKPHYVASYDPGSVHNIRTESFDSYLGDAVYMSDNPAVANGAAARDFKSGNGRIIEVTPGESLNLIDLNKPVPEELKSLLSEHGVTKAEMEKLPMMDIMHRIQDQIQSNERSPDFIESFNKELKAKGYDGYISNGANAEGIAREPHNSMIVFNKDKIKETGTEFQPEPDKVGQLAPEKLRGLQEESKSEVSQLVHDNPDKLIAEYEATKKEPVGESPKLRDVEADEKILHEQIGDLEKQELLDPSEQKVVEEVRAAQKDSETLTQMLKYAASCVGLD